MSTVKVAALQIGSRATTSETLAHIANFEDEIRVQGIQLLVLPEAVLGGYPKGEGFGTYLGYRLPEGRDRFTAYAAQAISIPGPEVDELAAIAARTGAMLVVGVIERAGATLYCTQIYVDPENGYTGKHRKLMPTATERLIWGQGDGSTLYVADAEFGRVGGAICWEHYMPMLRMAMYAQGIDIWAASTVDARDVWQASMRHIATEGRCFVVSACQYQAPGEAPGWDAESPLIAGGSVICDPFGEVIAGPLTGEEGLVVAEIDLSVIPGARYDLDVVGHYARPDVFSLSVNTSPRFAVTFGTDPEG